MTNENGAQFLHTMEQIHEADVRCQREQAFRTFPCSGKAPEGLRAINRWAIGSRPLRRTQPKLVLMQSCRVTKSPHQRLSRLKTASPDRSRSQLSSSNPY